MKRVGLPFLFLLFFLTALAQAQTGGNYDLTWNTYDGGGGFSVGGAFSLKGMGYGWRSV
jgi:hypothetical protein